MTVPFWDGEHPLVAPQRATPATSAFRHCVRRVWLSVVLVFLRLLCYRQVTGKLPADYFSVFACSRFNDLGDPGAHLGNVLEFLLPLRVRGRRGQVGGQLGVAP